MSVDEKTVADFGEQWTRHTDNEGYYGTKELLADIFGPLLSLDDVRGKDVADIGSGTGRIVMMLLDAGAAHVTAVEPSEAFAVLQANTAAHAERVRYVNARGEGLPSDRPLDLVVSIGVLHHIVDPLPVVRAAHAALEPGGRCLVWLYGHEGNEAYLRLAMPLRRITTRLPAVWLDIVCEAFNIALGGYVMLARWLPVPLAGYINGVIAKLGRDKRRLVIYDQLNPAYARYYRRPEAEALLRDAGFDDVQLYHRHGYSWTVMGTR